MGLTIQFKLVAPPETDEQGAEALVRQLRRRALGFKARGRVDRVHPLGGMSRIAALGAGMDASAGTRAIPTACYQADVSPLAGFIFAVERGRRLRAALGGALPLSVERGAGRAAGAHPSKRLAAARILQDRNTPACTAGSTSAAATPR